jgi:hypothetical protein
LGGFLGSFSTKRPLSGGFYRSEFDWAKRGEHLARTWVGQLPGRNEDILFFFFKDLFILCEYTVPVFRHIRRGHQISLQMVVSYHMFAGN